MKFKNQALNSLYNSAVTAIQALNWADALSSLQTLQFMMTEARENQNTMQMVENLVATIQNSETRA